MRASICLVGSCAILWGVFAVGGHRGDLSRRSLLGHVDTAVHETKPLVEPGCSPEESRRTAIQVLGRLPLAFIENRGQFDDRAVFMVRRGDMTTFFTRDAFVMRLMHREGPVPESDPFTPTRP
ncbi:MAG: hypothetical protein U1E76_06970 [Planctomycetota bacterium]